MGGGLLTCHDGLMDPLIEQARARHERSLVGAWTTALGSFGAVMAQHWEIRPDGSGTIVDTGPFGATRSETAFVWRQAQPFVFELRPTGFVDHDADGLAEDEEDDDGDAPWIAISYDFTLIPTEAGGEHVGLVDSRPHDASEPRTFFFYLSLAPLVFRAAL